ncbi:MAG: acyl-CoA desaturase [Actinomycetales bacterium]|nr:acyl-CoA desaturase [Actinomycetales bacterium]
MLRSRMSYDEVRQTLLQKVLLAGVIVLPLLAIALAVPFAWGGWLGWLDLLLAFLCYLLTTHGITVGFHRHFTHGAFRATRTVRLTLAILGSMAIQGPVIQWVADHRRHHQHSDAQDDPHSPWRYGTGPVALMRGLWWAHLGWLFDTAQSPPARYAPDLLADRDLVRVSRAFPGLVVASLLGPALIGGLLTWSWQGAVTAFFWASLIRIAVVHHMTWSINSICHVWGERPFRTRDHSGNVRWLAVISAGESWHNLHHCDPTLARHGVLPGQVDSSARVIAWLEARGLAWDVRWPDPERLRRRLVEPSLLPLTAPPGVVAPAGCMSPESRVTTDGPPIPGQRALLSAGSPGN